MHTCKETSTLYFTKKKFDEEGNIIIVTLTIALLLLQNWRKTFLFTFWHSELWKYRKIKLWHILWMIGWVFLITTTKKFSKEYILVLNIAINLNLLGSHCFNGCLIMKIWSYRKERKYCRTWWSYFRKKNLWHTDKSPKYLSFGYLGCLNGIMQTRKTVL